MTEEEEDALFVKGTLGKFEPAPRTSYETEQRYLGYLITSGDPVVAREGSSYPRSSVAMPLSALEAHVRTELAEPLAGAERRLSDYLGTKGFELRGGELLFVAEHDGRREARAPGTTGTVEGAKLGRRSRRTAPARPAEPPVRRGAGRARPAARAISSPSSPRR